MRTLPAIASGPGRWVLPMADRSANLLAGITLAGKEAGCVLELSDALGQDPPLVLWTMCQAARLARFRPARLLDLVDWLADHALEVLRANTAEKTAQPAWDATQIRRRGLEVERSLLVAELASELAGGDGPIASQEAYLCGLLHNAREWLALAASAGVTAEPPDLADWLPPGQGVAAERAQRAAEIAAGRTQGMPIPVADLEACRNQAASGRDAWLQEVPGLGAWLGELADRLHRLRQLEERFQEVLETEKLASMAELAAGAGHEINNPLAIIAGRAQLLLKEEADPERRRELATIVAQVKRAHEMIADLRLFARPPRPEPETFDLAPLLDALVEELGPQATERAIAIVRSGSAGPLVLEADPAQVSVALHALCRNAIEAIGHGGQIEVALRGDERTVSVRVADSGPGIAPEHRRHIFDPFFSARQAGRGLGMGLSKCWRIVTGHGGRVEVEGQPGQGAAFTITLPRRLAQDHREMQSAN